jgi:hypothetical protein
MFGSPPNSSPSAEFLKKVRGHTCLLDERALQVNEIQEANELGTAEVKTRVDSGGCHL